MTLLYRHVFAGMWLSWALYWWALSRNVKPSVRTESTSSRLLHIVPLMLAVAFLWLPRVPVPVLGERFVPPTAWPFWVARRSRSQACYSASGRASISAATGAASSP